ncbi:MAG: SDR family NAD(P)-dependent oxidoreductase [Alkalinema sp. FL-bin-369]|nr:SDR family NAD(P)-dependent oxidoreductase [Leptolyngbyaceae cyanobacterium LF-bin-369]
MQDALVLGASQGIGFGFVQYLLNQESIAQVYATYRSIDSAGPLLAVADQYGDRLTCIKLEITDEDQIIQCLQQVAAGLRTSDRQLGWVINCIGMLHQGDLQPEKSLRQINTEQLITYFQVNSIGSILLAKHLASLIKSTDRVIFATISAKVGSITDNQLGGWYGYRASKAALNMFMRSIAIEYRRTCKGAIVVVLHPGTTETGLSEPFRRGVPPDKLFSIDRTVGQLMQVMNGLSPEDSGEFFSWDGTPLPW